LKKEKPKKKAKKPAKKAKKESVETNTWLEAFIGTLEILTMLRNGEVSEEGNSGRGKRKRMTDEQYEEYLKRRREIAGQYADFARFARNATEFTADEYADAADAWEDKHYNQSGHKSDRRYAGKYQQFSRAQKAWDNKDIDEQDLERPTGDWGDEPEEFTPYDFKRFKEEDVALFNSMLREERQRARVKGGPSYRREAVEPEAKKKTIPQIVESQRPQASKKKRRENKRAKDRGIEETQGIS